MLVYYAININDKFCPCLLFVFIVLEIESRVLNLEHTKQVPYYHCPNYWMKRIEWPPQLHLLRGKLNTPIEACSQIPVPHHVRKFKQGNGKGRIREENNGVKLPGHWKMKTLQVTSLICSGIKEVNNRGKRNYK